jgi:hypothetical protein
MLIVGGTFVFFSGFLYFLFMSAWLNLFLVMGQVSMITTAAGVLSLLIASVNIKDFFLFKRGVSLTIPEGAKLKLFDRMQSPGHNRPRSSWARPCYCGSAYELLLPPVSHSLRASSPARPRLFPVSLSVYIVYRPAADHIASPRFGEIDGPTAY